MAIYLHRISENVFQNLYILTVFIVIIFATKLNNANYGLKHWLVIILIIAIL